MTYRTAVILAAAGSFALLAGAFAFQYIGGLPPCAMCLWQRWPHAAAILIGGVALMLRPSRALAIAGMLAAGSTAAIGLFHAGVEQGWWQGPTSCTGSGLSALSGSDLLSLDAAPPLVMCDQISWQMLGLSMAAWNGVLSLVLVMLWAVAAAKARHRG
ncbi:disulfide bond formation protein B [Pseudoruegeria sp. SK021]|uniref:disulfide bond formation protein B n=1 Tax=Pseudoruegeria sp. SK021 TaxID=1933035 RepID=UPI000A230A84|nr:disulfide bond formation protein B [Pseudoruegeria sp. SK021]OSP54299.1 disulfide bond formation protein B [Pseudoruegeria sp. SK021]